MVKPEGSTAWRAEKEGCCRGGVRAGGDLSWVAGGWRVRASGKGVPKEESGSRRPGVVRLGGALQLGVGGGERLDLRDKGLAAFRAE